MKKRKKKKVAKATRKIYYQKITVYLPVEKPSYQDYTVTLTSGSYKFEAQRVAEEFYGRFGDVHPTGLMVVDKKNTMELKGEFEVATFKSIKPVFKVVPL